MILQTLPGCGVPGLLLYAIVPSSPISSLYRVTPHDELAHPRQRSGGRDCAWPKPAGFVLAWSAPSPTPQCGGLPDLGA